MKAYYLKLARASFRCGLITLFSFCSITLAQANQANSSTSTNLSQASNTNLPSNATQNNTNLINNTCFLQYRSLIEEQNNELSLDDLADLKACSQQDLIELRKQQELQALQTKIIASNIHKQQTQEQAEISKSDTTLSKNNHDQPIHLAFVDSQTATFNHNHFPAHVHNPPHVHNFPYVQDKSSVLRQENNHLRGNLALGSMSDTSFHIPNEQKFSLAELFKSFNIFDSSFHKQYERRYPSSLVNSFNDARYHLVHIYYALNYKLGRSPTLYCGCPIIYTKKRTNIFWRLDEDNCPYEPVRLFERAKHLEFMHIMPPSRFAKDLPCWKLGPKKCLLSRAFKTMQSDMHNLYPTIGELKAERKDFRFTEFILPKNQAIKACTIYIDVKNKRVMPPETSRGVIARAYLYMEDRYHLTLSPDEKQQFMRWHQIYPVNRFECLRNKEITKIMGHDNKFISSQCALIFNE